jgi:D-beta-D-heptose 7-phosphate kinase/D-beta-D-heptose 1-phosphate adenosyltransferase
VTGGPLVIVGDALLDRDVDGHAARLCPDAPAPVIEAPAARERPGGAALAALLAAQILGLDAGDVTLIAPLGTDRASRTLRGLLPDGVSVVALPLRGALQEKTRIMADGRTMLRLDTPAPVPGRAGAQAVAAIKGAGALLVSDYGHGTTADRVIREALAAMAGKVPVVWDPHPRGSAPVPGTWLVTPNQAEATGESKGASESRADSAGSRGGRTPGKEYGEGAKPAEVFRDAAAVAGRLLGRWPSRAVAVTLGPRGALLARHGQPPLAVPVSPAGTVSPSAAVSPSAVSPSAVSSSAVDACGAGDMFAAAAAAALRGGALPSEAVTWAVDAASRFVAAGGVGSLAAADSMAYPGVRAGSAGPAKAGDARTGPAGPARAGGGPDGRVLVAAGGCFDVLHAGHVSMLRAARALGDMLVVCVNSDASVRRLKGAGRPLNPLADRVAVLRALDCVDDVVVFDEDTPQRLLGELRPDIWVKGGDYDGQELPEAAVLRNWGGLAVTVPYLDGRSTTRIARAAARLP